MLDEHDKDYVHPTDPDELRRLYIGTTVVWALALAVCVLGTVL